MKKIWLVLLAFVLIFGMISCSDDSGGGGNKKPKDFTTDLCQNGNLEITLTGNFEYGKGYQVNFMDAALFNGEKVNKDDKFTLEISFKANRDLTTTEKYLMWGLVDTVTGYWNPLSWTGDDDEWKLETKDLTTGNETTDIEITFIALKSSPDNAPAKNALNIQFESPDDKAVSGDSGTYNPNPLKLTFTKFRFSRGEGGTPPITQPDEEEFTIDAEAGTAVHDNFVIKPSPLGAHSSFDGEDNGDNSFSIKQGAIRYQFPVTTDFDYNDYDFVEVEYDAAVVNDTVYKQFANSNNFPPFKDTNNNNMKDGENTIQFEIRQSTGGFAIQKWNASSADTEIEITKITFIKGIRYTVSFNTDGGAPLTDTYLVDGTKVGNYLPVADGKTGMFFAGWLYPDGSAVSSTDDVDEDFEDITLKALWLAAIADLEPIEVSFKNTSGFTSGSLTVTLTRPDESDATVFYGYKYSGSVNYDWTGVKFDIEIPTGAVLAHYDYVKFKLAGTGDVNGKNWFLLAGTMNFNPVVDANKVSAGVYVNNANDVEVTIPIIKPAAASLSGTVPVSIWASMSSSAAPEFYDIVFGIND
jgi:hypothetical protein